MKIHRFIQTYLHKALAVLIGSCLTILSYAQADPDLEKHTDCPPPVITLQPDGLVFCISGNGVFFINATDATTYQWQIRTGSTWNDLTDGGIYSGSQVPALAVSNITSVMNGYVYRCVVSNACGSTLTDEAVITVKTPATPTITINTSPVTICAGRTATFNAQITDGGSNPVYQWTKNGVNTGTNYPFYTDNTPANGDVYSCILTSNAFCVNTSTAVSNMISLTVTQPTNPQVTITASTNTICPGTPVTFTATTTGPQPGNFTWFRNGTNLLVSGTTFTTNTLNNGDIIFCLMPAGSCTVTPLVFSNPITINTLPPPPTGFLGSDTAICSYGSIVLKADNVFNAYNWNDGSTGTTLKITKPGNYWLKATASNGCTGTDSITVAPKECLKGFYMPTGFTPNHDGKNDQLKPMMLGTVQQFHFWVYNRWGQLVFESKDPARGWDGRVNSAEQDQAVFIWICTYQFAGENVFTKKGTVALIR